MAKIEASTSSPTTAFVINGREYGKGEFGLFYDDKDFTAPDIYDEAKLKVGIQYKSKKKTLQDSLHYSDYTDVNDTPYASRQALVTAILGLITL